MTVLLQLLIKYIMMFMTIPQNSLLNTITSIYNYMQHTMMKVKVKVKESGSMSLNCTLPCAIM